MSTGRWSWAGAAALLGLVALAAVASLSGPANVARLTGSPFFIIPAAIVVTGAPVALLAAGAARSRRGAILLVVHFGIAVGLAGVVANARWSRSGYAFLEVGADGKDYYLSEDMRTLEPLAAQLTLDSATRHTRRGFRPAPALWLAAGGAASMVTYNRPWSVGSLQFVFSRTVSPGFPHEFELAVGEDQYILAHNQRFALPGGGTGWSYAFDAARGKMGFTLPGRTEWLAVGDTLDMDGVAIVLGPVRFSRREGAVLLVRDTRLRPVVFVGFGIALLGLAAVVFKRRRRAEEAA